MNLDARTIARRSNESSEDRLKVNRLAKAISTTDNVRSMNTRRLSSGWKWIALGIARCIPLIFHAAAGTGVPR